MQLLFYKRKAFINFCENNSNIKYFHISLSLNPLPDLKETCLRVTQFAIQLEIIVKQEEIVEDICKWSFFFCLFCRFQYFLSEWQLVCWSSTVSVVIYLIRDRSVFSSGEGVCGGFWVFVRANLCTPLKSLYLLHCMKSII